jgi:galactoside O-acetyltransferase
MLMPCGGETSILFEINMRGFNNYESGELVAAGMSVGDDVNIANDVIIHNPRNIVIGSNVRIDTQCMLIAGHDTKITIGNDVHISAGCYFYGSSGNITLEDCTCTSGRCILYTANDDYTEGYIANSMADEKYKKVTTGDILLRKHALVGCYTVILPGVVLDYATSVGAHSLVNKSTNPFDIIAGAPAKFIKKRKNVYLN